MLNREISRTTALVLFAVVIFAWGLNWPVTKIIVAEVTPLWTVAIRTGIACAVLLMLLWFSGQLALPRPGDIPVIVAIGFFHMVAFSALMAAGLKYVPAGRSVVLGYTTPLWVTPGAWLFLKEDMPPSRLIGIALGLCGLVVMFNPLAFDWSDRQALIGNGLLLLSALSWSVSILYVRAHEWISTPFQLGLWQTLLATVVLTVLALLFEPLPDIRWTTPLVFAFGYNVLIGTVLGFWAMAVVNRSVPATTTSLGILGTPVVGIVGSALLLGETIDLPLILATAMILTGVAIGTFSRR
ncbi:DMT family transporter [Phreatobacter stygius]|uniref:EamA family transporter n=1 Tax=Phreatobacter stygius TaxID=1940610 RepID=A0A4D7B961_9HYPH|nr:DMT family transporter [Phreatobacter stygius]QCI67445.1 EamA family transporter [Phreatobacter stygius]